MCERGVEKSAVWQGIAPRKIGKVSEGCNDEYRVLFVEPRLAEHAPQHMQDSPERHRLKAVTIIVLRHIHFDVVVICVRHLCTFSITQFLKPEITNSLLLLCGLQLLCQLSLPLQGGLNTVSGYIRQDFFIVRPEVPVYAP